MAENEVWRHKIESVGVIGLGGIGLRVCRRLAGSARILGLKTVAGFDTEAQAAADPVNREVEVCKSIAHLVDRVDLVLLCLPETGDVGRVARSHEGLLDCVRQGQVIVDHSWSSFDLTRQLATAFTARGAAFLDAPIGRSGDVDRAIDAGRVAIAIGGRDAVVEAVSPALGCFAGQITKVGAVGTAQVVRQLGDLVALQTFSALAEALSTARAFEVDGDRLFEALARGNGVDVGLGRHVLADFLGTDDGAASERTTVAEARDRLDEAIGLAKGKRLSLAGASSTLTLLDEVMEKGLGEKDLSALFSMIAPDAGETEREGRRRA